MGKNAIEVYKIGSKVKLDDDVYGVIISIVINGDNDISYECGWWNSRSYSTQHFAANQIQSMIDEKTKIGFV